MTGKPIHTRAKDLQGKYRLESLKWWSRYLQVTEYRLHTIYDEGLRGQDLIDEAMKYSPRNIAFESARASFLYGRTA